ncbi:MAG: cobyrinate a,c-diamide synthase [Yoonia sp.]|nr:cobyrinate a,c-diamide synthase [Yoonia sp.]
MRFVIAAPASGSGKTTVTLGLLRAFAQDGIAVSGAKSGPDYIDPRFHEAACGQPCLNLDAWAMTPQRIRGLAPQGDLIIEGAMGLFDGAPPNGKGASADLARLLNIPVVLVVDAGRMAQSVAPIVQGFAQFDPTVPIAGVILNNVGSDRHEAMLRAALAPIDIPILGTIRRNPALRMPSRHLGLVQAQERSDLDEFLNLAAEAVRAGIDLDAVRALGSETQFAANLPMPHPATRIAVAQDAAFAFAYPHLLADWHASGASIKTFSPLNDDPVPKADLVYLPGGYPELYAGQLAGNTAFMQSLRNASQTSDIYGECGGYMTLGQTLTDADGIHHKMAGLLDLGTSFAKRKLHLGYRMITANAGPLQGPWNAHEFHYASTMFANGKPLFTASDATGTALPDMGLRNGRVSGSFAHIIDAA